MLSENIYVNKGGTSVSEVVKKSIDIKCPKCGTEYTVNNENIEDYTDSDPHDPLQDYFICPECGKPTGLFKGIDGLSDGKKSLLWADGTFIYIKVEEEDFRIV